MAEIINNPRSEEGSSAPWAIVAIVLIIVVGGLAWFFLRGRIQAPAPQQPNINVEVPVPQVPGGDGGAGGGGGGAPAPAQ